MVEKVWIPGFRKEMEGTPRFLGALVIFQVPCFSPPDGVWFCFGGSGGFLGCQLAGLPEIRPAGALADPVAWQSPGT